MKSIRFLALLLCAALLLPLVPVHAAQSGGSFYLTASTAGQTLIEPVAVPYTAGQTIRDALRGSGYAFGGIDTAFITDIEGVAGNFTVYYDGGAYSLDAIASPETVTAVVFSERERGFPALLDAVTELARFRERTEVERLLRQERWEDTRRQIQEAYAKGARRRQAQLEESLRRRTDAKLTALANIQEALEAYRDRLAVARDLTEESLEARRAEVQQLLDRLRDREASIRARTARRYRQSLRILRGNPSASAKAFAEALESLRKLGDRREGEDGE